MCRRCSSRKLGDSCASTRGDAAVAQRAAARCAAARRVAIAAARRTAPSRHADARCRGRACGGGVSARHAVAARPRRRRLGGSIGGSAPGGGSVRGGGLARGGSARGGSARGGSARDGSMRGGSARGGSTAASRRWAHHSEAACAHPSCLCVLLRSYSSVTLCVRVLCYCDARPACLRTATGRMMDMLLGSGRAPFYVVCVFCVCVEIRERALHLYLPRALLLFTQTDLYSLSR